MSDGDFLSRWSRRKHAAKRGEPLPSAAAPDVVPGSPRAGAIAPAEPPPPSEPLPPVDSLTPESDFAPFMRDKVDPGLRRQALRTLFRDPRFNVMDGLDVYIDDFSKPDPIPPDWLEKLNQVARLGDYRPPEVAPEAPGEAVPLDGTEAKPTEEQALAGSEAATQADTSVEPSPPPELKESDP
jgi:hypothetical protein